VAVVITNPAETRIKITTLRVTNPAGINPAATKREATAQEATVQAVTKREVTVQVVTKQEATVQAVTKREVTVQVVTKLVANGIGHVVINPDNIPASEMVIGLIIGQATGIAAVDEDLAASNLQGVIASGNIRNKPPSAH